LTVLTVCATAAACCCAAAACSVVPARSWAAAAEMPFAVSETPARRVSRRTRAAFSLAQQVADGGQHAVPGFAQPADFVFAEGRRHPRRGRPEGRLFAPARERGTRTCGIEDAIQGHEAHEGHEGGQEAERIGPEPVGVARGGPSPTSF
jgi:hypothetical protein